MLTKRIITCLDVKNGEVVKGVNFKGLRTLGNPVEMAKAYYSEGADEITFLDISASQEGRGTMLEVVRQTADQVFVPLTVGGGVRSAEDVNELLKAGADKVGINTAAIENPRVISEIAERFGKQVLVLSVDARRFDGHFIVTTHGGSVDTEIDALEWIKDAEERGAGEILLNSMDVDGTKQGFDLEMINAAKAVTKLPLIASGGAGKVQDFQIASHQTSADAFLAASVFHLGEVSISSAKLAIQ